MMYAPSHRFTPERIWTLLFALLFILLSLQSTKIGGARLGQLWLLLLFGIVFAIDLKKHRVAFEVLLFFWMSAAIFSLISHASIYPKTGEIKFLIKFFLIFPAAFYVGMRMVDTLTPRRLVTILEIAALFDATVAYLIYFFPMPHFVYAFVHFREGAYGTTYLDFQGTFFEGGIYAYVVGALLLGSITLRIDHELRPRRKTGYALFLLYIVLSLFLSENKTVWIAYIAILLFLVLYKSYRLLGHSSRFQPMPLRMEDRPLKLLGRIHSGYAFALIVLIALSFWAANELLPKPIITVEMIRIKLEQERGKALLVVLDLLKRSHWIGGYGFGFVEHYFSTAPFHIIGLGEGVSMVFNSFLDIWLQGSLFGILYLLLILMFAFSTLSFFTMAIPIYFFIFANFNPIAAGEEFFIFMGLSYKFAQRLRYAD